MANGNGGGWRVSITDLWKWGQIVAPLVVAVVAFAISVQQMKKDVAANKKGIAAIRRALSTDYATKEDLQFAIDDINESDDVFDHRLRALESKQRIVTYAPIRKKKVYRRPVEAKVESVDFTDEINWDG